MAAAKAKMAKGKFGAAGAVLLLAVLWAASFAVAAAATETTAEPKATDGSSSGSNDNDINTSADGVVERAVSAVVGQIAPSPTPKEDRHPEDVRAAANKSLKRLDDDEKRAKKYKHASYGLAGLAALGGLGGLFAAIHTARKAGGEAPLSKKAKGAGIAAAVTALLGLGGAVFSSLRQKREEEKMRARARHVLLLREVIREKGRERAAWAERLRRESREEEAEVFEKEEKALWEEAHRFAAEAERTGLFVPELLGEPTTKE